MPLADVRPSQDHDLVVDCTGSPDGLRLGLQLVRPRGIVVLKSTCARGADLDLTPAVVNEVTILGSRCGPFGDAINALAAKQVDVTSMISEQLPLAEAPKALALAADQDHIKVLLRIAE
jgi:threonine dehydrogenase-like Zn-dependent dehydrogenase